MITTDIAPNAFVGLEMFLTGELEDNLQSKGLRFLGGHIAIHCLYLAFSRMIQIRERLDLFKKKVTFGDKVYQVDCAKH